MTASAFDLLRSSQRRTRHAPIAKAPLLEGGTGLARAAPIPEAAAPAPQTLASPASPQRPREPLRAGAVGADERVGLWWAVRGRELLYFPLRGQQWPPCASHVLPEDAALDARCVAILAGVSAGGQPGAARSPGPCTVAVLPDLRISVFTRGERQDVPRPDGAPLAQVPAFVAAAAPHPSPGAQGSVLVVGTAAGGLFGLFLQQCGERFEAEASPLWSNAAAEGGILGLLKRLRRSVSGAPEPSPAIHAEGPNFLVRSVEVVPPPAGSDALFGVLALGDEALACFLQPRRSGAAAELAWLLPVGSLTGGLQPPPQLLSVRCFGEDPQALLLLYTGQRVGQQDPALGHGGATPGQGTVLACLAWPSRMEPPRAPAVSQQLPVGPTAYGPLASGQAVAFLAASAQLSTVLIRVQEHRWILSVVQCTGDAMRLAEASPIEADVLGLSLLAPSAVALLTPHGMLEVPTSSSEAAVAAEQPPEVADATEALQLAHSLYSTGQEARAASIVMQAFSQHGAAELLSALEGRTQAMLDASDVSGSRWQGVAEDVVTRHLLFDKARDLEQWACFLSDSGVWARLAALPGCAAARQALAEACERVAAASRLRELHDREPEVVGGAIHRALNEADWPVKATTADAVLSEAHRFYAQASCCERLLACLAEYPRSLPLGSSQVADAVVFANGVVAAFLEAALERRGQLVAAHPLLLPPPAEEQTRRHLEGSVRPPAGIGSDWLVSTRMRQGLEDLRLVNLEVLPMEPSRGLPLLEAQAVRVLESLKGLCRSFLRAASASYCDLHGGPMLALRAGVLEQLAEAEARFAPAGPPRGALALAEEFEGFEAMVTFLAAAEPQRLEELLNTSLALRAHALRQFLRVQALQPWFFRTARRFELSPAEIEELLVPYPELRWTLEVEGLDERSADVQWRASLEEVERRAAGTLHRERHSAAKRDAFAALAVLARAAAGGAEGSEEPAVAEAACLGRLQQACRRFSEEAASPTSVGSKRPSPSGPPASAEECLQQLCGCFRAASRGLRSEGCERRLFADAARLVRILERQLRERGVDMGPLLHHDPGEDPLAASKDKLLVQSLQGLWAEAVLADEGKWKQVLVAPEGAARDEVIQETGFYCMLAWRGSPGAALAQTPWIPPRTCELPPLCGAYESLRHLAPALRLAAQAAAAPNAGGCAGAFGAGAVVDNAR